MALTPEDVSRIAHLARLDLAVAEQAARLDGVSRVVAVELTESERTLAASVAPELAARHAARHPPSRHRRHRVAVGLFR